MNNDLYFCALKYGDTIYTKAHKLGDNVMLRYAPISKFQETTPKCLKNCQNENLLSPSPSLTIWVLAFNFTPHTCVHLSKTD